MDSAENMLNIAVKKTRNNELQNSPQLLNTDPENTGWYMKIKIDNTEELTNLMNFNQYKEMM